MRKVSNMPHYNVIFVLSVSMLSVHCNDVPLVVRTTANGPVEGLQQTSSLGQKYYSFRGIPFAEPPITGKDPYTGEEVDRRFKVRHNIKSVNLLQTSMSSVIANDDKNKQ